MQTVRNSECVVSLENKKGMIFGMANEHSIAYGVAKVCRAAGAEIGVTYLNEKAEPHVRPLAEELESTIIMPCNVQQPGDLETVFDRVRQ